MLKLLLSYNEKLRLSSNIHSLLSLHIAKEYKKTELNQQGSMFLMNKIPMMKLTVLYLELL
jgi:hypothetical protein